MTTASKTRPRATPTWTRRSLTEQVPACAPGSPLKIDRDKRVIYGVKVLGRFSRNSHGLREATNGTEYTLACMREALPLYEGVEVMANHLTGPGTKARGVEDVLGVIRNARVEDDGIRADLHYLESHRTTAAVLEDVERAIGVFGLSHDAEAGRERFDRANRRLVIESLKSVRSVDLVRKPATNRNLWESGAVKTLRQLLEGLQASPARQKWARRLLEMDDMPAMDAPAPVDGGGDADPLTAGFKSAIMAVVDDDSMDAAGKLAKIKLLLTTHEKLTAEPEPEEPKKEEDETDKDKDKADDQKSESVKEVEVLKHKLKVRELCEAAGIAKPDKVLLESLEAVPEATARKLLEREKARGGATTPRSQTIQTGGNSGDFKPAANGSELARRIKG